MEGAYIYRKNQYNHYVTKIEKIKKLVSGLFSLCWLPPIFNWKSILKSRLGIPSKTT